MKLSRAIALVGGLLLLSGCTAQLDEPPEPPDMEALVRGYFQLSGKVGALSDEEALGVVTSEADRFEQFCELAPGATCEEPPCGSCAITQFTAGTLNEIVGEVFSPDPNAFLVGGKNFTADGFLEVERICEGNGDVIDRSVNGAIDLRGTFTEERLDPVFWGGFDRCSQPVFGDPEPWQIDTAINIHAETPTFDELQNSETRVTAETLVPLVVLDVEGRIDRDGFVVDIDDDTVYNQTDKELALRAQRDGLEFLLVLNLGDGSVSLRGDDQDYRCGFDLGGCVRVSR